MENKRRLTNKYILLAILLIAVFVLPSCRTRISNNSEITTVQYDESGFMSEDYQMRRDELGLSTAEKPLLPNFGSGESDDSDDFEEGEYIDYNPEDYQEDFTETETNTNNNNNNRNNSNTGTRNRSTTPSRPSPGGTTTTRYTVTFNANGGEPKEQKKLFTKTNNKLAFPSQPTRSGYEFNGWWTSSKDGEGSQAKVGDEVKGSKTLYAHWKKKETPKPKPDPKPTVREYKVTFTDGMGNTLSEQKVKEKKSAVEPKKPSRDGYVFAGWDASFSKITADMVINATWDPKKDDPAYWADVTDKEVRDITSQPLCFVDGGESGIVQSCSAKATRKEEDYDSAEYVIAYASNDEEAETLKTKHEGRSLLIISKDATKDDKEYRAVYRIIILNWLHGSSLSYKEAADELNIDYKIYYPKEDDS